MPVLKQRNIVDDIVQDLGGQILAGDIAPGERLPTYRELTDDYGVTLPTTQRAMAKLEEMGLIRVRQGSGAVALEPLRHAHPGVLPYWIDALRKYPSQAKKVLEDFLELRRDLAVSLIIRFRHHADGEQLHQIRQKLEDMAVLADSGAPLGEIVEADIEIIHEMIYVAEQIAYATIFNAFARLLRAVPDIQEVMYVSPTHNIRAWDAALDLADSDSPDEFLETQIGAALEDIDKHTVNQFIKRLRKA